MPQERVVAKTEEIVEALVGHVERLQAEAGSYRESYKLMGEQVRDLRERVAKLENA